MYHKSFNELERKRKNMDEGFYKHEINDNTVNWFIVVDDKAAHVSEVNGEFSTASRDSSGGTIEDAREHAEPVARSDVPYKAMNKLEDAVDNLL